MGAPGSRDDGETLTVRQMLVPVGAVGQARLPAESEVSWGDKVVEGLPPSAGGRDVRRSICYAFCSPVGESSPPVRY